MPYFRPSDAAVGPHLEQNAAKDKAGSGAKLACQLGFSLSAVPPSCTTEEDPGGPGVVSLSPEAPFATHGKGRCT